MANKISPDSPYIGVWKPTGTALKGMEVTFENAPYTLDLREDGSATVTKDKAYTGTWTETDSGVHVKAGDTDDDFRYEDGKLIVKVALFGIVLEKQ